jgi:hypothetical protein
LQIFLVRRFRQILLRHDLCQFPALTFWGCKPFFELNSAHPAAKEN